jgi:2-methylisocitrate lyase-like PEP mutase family enzyme
LFLSPDSKVLISSNMATKPLTGAKRLRELLSDRSKIILCPGVFDGLTARIALAQKFDALYMTGAGTSISKLGWADLGMATLNDMVDNASMIASLDPSVPLIADADTGYGGPVMVTRTVIQYARAGVAALHIEDQVQEKRCGHLLDKQIVDREIYYSRLRAAVAARNELGSDMLIIARSDARQTQGLDEAVERLQEAVKIGVDIIFCEAMQSKEEAKKVCEIFGDTPCLLNMVSGGSTPEISVNEARDLGFRIIIYPGACIEPILSAVSNELTRLQTEGTSSLKDFGQGAKKVFNLSGLQECIEIDRKAGGQAYDNVGH